MVTHDIENIVNEFLSRNRGPGYAVAITHVADDLATIHITITFLSRRTYCCAEPFCHVPRDLSKFIHFAARHGLVLPPQLQIRWHFVVEEGSLLSCNETFDAPLQAKRQEYDEVSG